MLYGLYQRMLRSCLRMMNLLLLMLLSGKNIGPLGSKPDGKTSVDEKCSVMVRLCLYLGEGGRHCPVCATFGLWLRELREHDESFCSQEHHLICWAVVGSFRYRLMLSTWTFSRFTDWMIDHISIKLFRYSPAVSTIVLQSW